MKNLGKLFGTISLVAVILCAVAACELINPNPNAAPPDQTPVSGDYDIGNLTQPAGSVTAVIITPRTGRSSGARTIYYEGTGSTTYARTTTVPASGASGSTYAVTFDVAAATGWNAATGLSAGTLTVGTPTPVSGDYTFTNLTQTAGEVTAVIITPKDGKSGGARTIYYAGSGTLPQAAGTYVVTFDVASATGWNAATGLSAGNLVVNTNQTPKESDYEITRNLTQIVGSVTAAVTVRKIAGSDGELTIYYEGVSPATTYAKSSTLPTAAGKYTVTFEVKEASGWNPATFVVGTLTISTTTQTPVASDFEIKGQTRTFNGYWDNEEEFTITPKEGKSTGEITILYKGKDYPTSTNTPWRAGTYTVTFNVEEAPGWNAAYNLSAGTLTINKREIKSSEIVCYSLDQKVSDVNEIREVHIYGTYETEYGFGSYYFDYTVYYEGRGETTYSKSTYLPRQFGTYTVTFIIDDPNYIVPATLPSFNLTISEGEPGESGPQGGGSGSGGNG